MKVAQDKHCPFDQYVSHVHRQDLCVLSFIDIINEGFVIPANKLTNLIVSFSTISNL